MTRKLFGHVFIHSKIAVKLLTHILLSGAIYYLSMRGSNLQASDHQLDRHSTEPPRPTYVVGTH